MYHRFGVIPTDDTIKKLLLVNTHQMGLMNKFFWNMF